MEEDGIAALSFLLPPLAVVYIFSESEWEWNSREIEEGWRALMKKRDGGKQVREGNSWGFRIRM